MKTQPAAAACLGADGQDIRQLRPRGRTGHSSSVLSCPSASACGQNGQCRFCPFCPHGKFAYLRAQKYCFWSYKNTLWEFPGYSVPPKIRVPPEYLIVGTVAQLFGRYGWMDYRLSVDTPNPSIVPVRRKLREPSVLG